MRANGSPFLSFASSLPDISSCPVVVGAVSQQRLFIVSHIVALLFPCQLLWPYAIYSLPLWNTFLMDLVCCVVFFSSCLSKSISVFSVFQTTETYIHNSLKLTGVYIVIFSLNSHSWV